MAESLHLYAILTSNTSLQDEIDKLENQMGGLQPGTPEYEYDQLVLEKEQMELKVREENPNLNPQTLAGSEALNELLEQNPDYQMVTQKIKDLSEAYPFESTNWGIPMDTEGATYVEIN